ncbi:MAG: chromate transporter [Clostridium sp.]|nr:chromate transporter [Clostridium sp.]
MKQDLKKLWVIYIVMFKIGAITFGGGWSIISQVQEEFVEKRPWVSEEQIMDYMSLARSFPGIMVVNFSILSGYAMYGISGAVAAAFGLVSPAILVIALVALFYDSIKSNPLVVRVLNGIRSAVIPIVLLAAWKLRSRAVTIKLQWLLALAALLVCAFTSIPKTMVILFGAVIGFLIQKKGGGDNAVS